MARSHEDVAALVKGQRIVRAEGKVGGIVLYLEHGERLEVAGHYHLVDPPPRRSELAMARSERS
jgi:hypothetical protein